MPPEAGPERPWLGRGAGRSPDMSKAGSTRDRCNAGTAEPALRSVRSPPPLLLLLLVAISIGDACASASTPCLRTSPTLLLPAAASRVVASSSPTAALARPSCGSVLTPTLAHARPSAPVPLSSRSHVPAAAVATDARRAAGKRSALPDPSPRSSSGDVSGVRASFGTPPSPGAGAVVFGLSLGRLPFAQLPVVLPSVVADDGSVVVAAADALRVVRFSVGVCCRAWCDVALIAS
mmetsp:Transcript_46104/g.141986  ORF Transcript_46104/g.141986 Transcript_46104/m.141986 type:complete len:235 (-) Transcript_46104:1122-1826(-)